MQTLFEFNKNKDERLFQKGVLTTSIIRGIDPKSAWKLIDRQLSLNGAPRDNCDESRQRKILDYAKDKHHLAGSFYFLLDGNKLYYILATSKDYSDKLPDNCYEKELNLNNPLFQLVKQLIATQHNNNPLRFRYMTFDALKTIALGKLNTDLFNMQSVITQLDGLIAEGKEVLSESERPSLPKLSILEHTELPLDEAFNNQLENMTFNLTYQLIFTSLVEKMKDNFYQLFVINPYEMGRAILNIKVGSFFYHFFGLMHALFSILIDLAVEVSAFVIHSVKQVGLCLHSCFFSSARPSTSLNEQVNTNQNNPN